MAARKPLLTYLNAGVSVPVAEQVIELADESGCSLRRMTGVLIVEALAARGIAVE